MADTTPDPTSPAAFEETMFTRAAQLVADPVTDSTRKRQNILLLLSVLSLAVFFGIAAPQKVSLPGVDVGIVSPSTPSGAPSTTAASIAHTALRFNRVLSPVLLYCLLSFWLSLYRDHKAQDYLNGLARFKIEEAAQRDYEVGHKRRMKQLAIIKRFQQAVEERHEECDQIQQKVGEIGEEFRKVCGPIRDEHAKAVAEFERLRQEGLPRNPDLESRMLGLGAQMRALVKKQDEDTQPLVERFDALMNDPEIRKLDLKLDAMLDDWSELKKNVERKFLVMSVKDDVRRWQRFWYLLEVVFPSGLGLVAFVIPLRSIW
jgi:hypothetical protein